MKKITKIFSKSESIKIIEKVKDVPSDNTPLVASSPVRWLTCAEQGYSSSDNDIKDQMFTPEYVPSEDGNTENAMGRNSEDEHNSSDEMIVQADQIISRNDQIISRNDKIDMCKRLLPSLAVSVGTGLAMMPIFNNIVKNSEQFGIDIHSNKDLFITSTANTFIVASFSSFATMYDFIKTHQQDLSKESNHICLSISKVAASCSLILPLGLLWGVELHNQSQSGSSGFDEFMAWAAFTTAPLIIDRIVSSVNTVDSIVNNNKTIDLNSIGEKLVVYGLSGLSIAGRSIAFTEVAKTLALNMGFSSETALVTGIITGGVLGSGSGAIFEYQNIKSLFEKTTQPIGIKNIAYGAIAAAEGAWFTLPLVSLGLQLMDEWNPLLKAVIVAPLFVSHTVFQANQIYNNLMTAEEIGHDIVEVAGCCETYSDN